MCRTCADRNNVEIEGNIEGGGKVVPVRGNGLAYCNIEFSNSNIAVHTKPK